MCKCSVCGKIFECDGVTHYDRKDECNHEIEYFLERKESVGEREDGTEILDWVRVPNTQRLTPYSEEELRGKKNWRIIKVITRFEVVK